MRTTPLLTAALVAAALTASVRADLPLIYTNISNLLPNTPNQVLKIYVSGTDVIQGENLDFQINTGGSGPFFTGLNIITGTIFAGSNTGQTVPNDTTNFNSQGILISGSNSGHLAVASTTTVSPNVTTDNGLLAIILITTTATTGTIFTLSMLNTLNGDSKLLTGGTGTLSFNYPHTQFSVAATPDRQWKTNGSGSWNTDANWNPFAPYAQGDSASFLGALTSGTAVVSVDAVRTVGSITFNDTAGNYDLQPVSGGSILLDNGTQTALLSDLGGKHTIEVPIALVAATNVSVAAGSTLTISGAFSGTSSSLSLAGGGLLLITASGNNYGATNIAAGASMRVGNGAQAGSFGTGAINNSGTLTISTMAAPLSVPLSGSGAVIIDGFLGLGSPSTSASMIITSTGNVQVGSGGLLIGGSVSNGGNLGFNRTDAAVHTAVITGGGTLTQAGSGTTTLTGAANYSGPTIISAGKLNFSGGVSHAIGAVSGAGILQVDTSTTLTSDGINMPASTLAINGLLVIRTNSGASAYADIANRSVAVPGTSLVSGLSFSGSGSLNLMNNGLIVEAANSSSKSTLMTTLAAEIHAGTITSSTAASNAKYTLALADNADLGFSFFGGLPVDANSIIITEALKGDGNLDGIVAGDDFDRWFNNNGSHLNSVTKGDYTGDGLEAGDDFDFWFNNNGSTLVNSPAPGSANGGTLGGGGGLGSSPVPEPASLLLLGFGAIGLISRRGRRSAPPSGIS